MICVFLVILIASGCQSLPTSGCPSGSTVHRPPYDRYCCEILHCPRGTATIPCDGCKECDDDEYSENGMVSTAGYYHCSRQPSCTNDGVYIAKRGSTTERRLCKCKDGYVPDESTINDELKCNRIDCPAGEYQESTSGDCVPCLGGTYKSESGMQKCKDCTICLEATISICNLTHDSNCVNSTKLEASTVDDLPSAVMQTTTWTVGWIVGLILLVAILIGGIVIAIVFLIRMLKKRFKRKKYEMSSSFQGENDVNNESAGNKEEQETLINKQKEVEAESPASGSNTTLKDSGRGSDTGGTKGSEDSSSTDTQNNGMIDLHEDNLTAPKKTDEGSNALQTHLPVQEQTSLNLIDAESAAAVSGIPSDEVDHHRADGQFEDTPSSLCPFNNNSGSITNPAYIHTDAIVHTAPNGVNRRCRDREDFDSVDNGHNEPAANPSQMVLPTHIPDITHVNDNYIALSGVRDISTDHVYERLSIPKGLDMTPKYKKAIDENRTKLVLNVVVEGAQFWASLRESKILSRDLEEIIKYEKCSGDKTHALLDVILKKSDPGFEAFIKALVVSEQSHIAKYLNEELAAKYISQLHELTSFERPGRNTLEGDTLPTTGTSLPTGFDSTDRPANDRPANGRPANMNDIIEWRSPENNSRETEPKQYIGGTDNGINLIPSEDQSRSPDAMSGLRSDILPSAGQDSNISDARLEIGS